MLLVQDERLRDSITLKQILTNCQGLPTLWRHENPQMLVCRCGFHLLPEDQATAH
jgi:hypothetical protein